jgi:two-component system cell cycle sensor histidine kinase/response regulator CckA
LGIVEASGGFVRIDPKEGEGTSVSVLLPGSDGVAAELLAPVAPAPARTGSVRVVEDQPEVRRVVERILSRASFATHAAAGANTALSMLRGGLEVDFELADVMMPDMSGVDLERLLSEEYPAVPVVLMTGYADAHIIPKGRTGPLLRKPFMPNELLQLVSEFFSDK